MLDNPDPLPKAPQRGDPADAIAVGGLIALAVAMGIGRFPFMPLLPMMQEDAGVSVAAGGWHQPTTSDICSEPCPRWGCGFDRKSRFAADSS